jgi:hypothetical protein
MMGDGEFVEGEIMCVGAKLGERSCPEIASKEINCVGAGLGGGFQHTSELKPMKYRQAMMTKDKKRWEKAVEEEYERMSSHNVWQAVLRKDVPAAYKIITSTWAMKKKANRTFRARLNARGFEQKPGEHYDESSISAPVTNCFGTNDHGNLVWSNCGCKRCISQW